MEILLSGIKNSISAVLHRYHFIFFMIVVVGGVAAFVFLLNAIVIRSAASSTEELTTKSTSFDQKTIERINQYKSRDAEPTKIDFSGMKRTNPFKE